MLGKNSGLEKSILEEFSEKAHQTFRESNYHNLNIAIYLIQRGLQSWSGRERGEETLLNSGELSGSGSIQDSDCGITGILLIALEHNGMKWNSFPSCRKHGMLRALSLQGPEQPEVGITQRLASERARSLWNCQVLWRLLLPGDSQLGVTEKIWF